MSGWIALYRATFDHPIFRGHPERVGVWAWILATAAWKDTKQDANGKTVVVKRGQLLTSYRRMSDATGASLKTCRNLISRLSDGHGGGHAIDTDTGTGQLLITIRNYDKYQTPKTEGGTPSGTGGAHEGHTKEQGNKDITLEPSGSKGADAPTTHEVSVASSAVWNAGKPFLTSRGISNPGAMIGRWLKTHSAIEVLSAIDAAQKADTQDPIPYITQTLNGGTYDQPPSKSQARLNAFIAGAVGTS